MMLRKGLVLLSALSMAASAPAFAADLAAQPAPPCSPCGPSRHAYVRHDHGGDGPGIVYGVGVGVAYGLTPGVGQLGASGFGYYGVHGCWGSEPAYDTFGNYFGQRAVNICLTPN